MATEWKVTDFTVAKLNDTTVIARWKFNTGTTTDHFEIKWQWWSTLLKTWVQKSDKWDDVSLASKVDGYFQTTWSPPQQEDATSVRAAVKPIPKKGGGWKGAYLYSGHIPNPWFTAHASEERKRREAKPDAPSSVVAEIADGLPSVSFACDAEFATKVNIYRSVDGGAFGLAASVSKTASPWKDRNAVAGSSYRYRLRSALADGRESDATDIADPVEMKPAKMTDFRAKALTSESVQLDWTQNGRTGDVYWVEYTDDGKAWENKDFDKITVQDIPFSKSLSRYTQSGLEPGKRWYFRIGRRNGAGAVNAHTGKGEITVSAIIGTVPAAPTLATTPSTVDADGSIALAWTHNCEDGSDQSAWEVELRASSEYGYTDTARSGTGKTSSISVRMSDMTAIDGSTCSWRVRTKGIAGSWSPWSERRTWRVWAKLASEIRLEKPYAWGGDPEPLDWDPDEGAYVVREFPFAVSLSNNMARDDNCAISWWLSITADHAHTRTAADGEDMWISQGQEVFSHVIEVEPGTDERREVRTLVGLYDTMMGNGSSYTVRGGCVTTHGTRCEATPVRLYVDIDFEEIPPPLATFAFDPETLTCRVTPVCWEYGDDVSPDGGEGTLREGVYLSVYRIAPDGTATLLAEDMPNWGNRWVDDPHPSFGTCRYRIVARDFETGFQSASEGDAETPFDSICIQWGDSWYRVWDEDGAEGVASDGRRLVLPYNIKTSERYAPDVALREYAGRSAPVAYYGTQRGRSATWSADIVKEDDAETLALLRELAGLMEDVYVREPSGVGYWAHVEVSGIEHGYGTSAVSASVSVTAVEHAEEGIV